MEKKIIASAILLLSVAYVAKADFLISSWRYKKTVDAAHTGLVKVAADKDLFKHAQRGLGDVRVIDGSGSEVPYKLLILGQEDGKKEYPANLINNASVSGKYSMAILDFGSRGIVTNALTIKTSSENFQRNVKIYGSDDLSNWNLLKGDGYIYDFTDTTAHAKTQDTTVFFSDSVYRYVKVEISDGENRPVKIDGVVASQRVRKNSDQFSVPSTFTKVNEQSNGQTALIADFAQEGYPVSKVSFVIAGENFNRRVLVYSGQDKNAKEWRYIGDGYVFRYDTPKFKGENLTIAVGEASDRYLKFVFQNNDNAPLSIQGIEGFVTNRVIIFDATREGRYVIYYGNTSAGAPRYDIDTYLKYYDLADVSSVILGGEVENERFSEVVQQKPFSERSPYFLPIMLTVTGLLLLFLVYKFLKQ